MANVNLMQLAYNILRRIVARSHIVMIYCFEIFKDTGYESICQKWRLYNFSCFYLNLHIWFTWDNTHPFILFKFISAAKYSIAVANLDFFANNWTFQIFYYVDADHKPVWTWAKSTPSRLGSNYFSETFSLSHIKLTYNNPNKDFKSVKRP